MLVKDFKETEGYRFPEAFLDSLPDMCLDADCNSPTQITDVLTSLCCSNPCCPSKIVKRVLAMVNTLGVKNLGEARARDMVRKFGIENPLCIFAYSPDEDGTLGESISMDVSRDIYNQISSKKTFTLAEYVRIANLPFIQSSATYLFGQYDDIHEAYRAIENGGVSYIRDCLNIKRGAKSQSDDGIESEDSIGDVSIRALKIYESLMANKLDLINCIPYVNIVKLQTEGMHVIKAVCSEEVGAPYKTKNDFYASVNSLYPDIHVDFGGNVTKATEYLVWAGAEFEGVRVTNKVKKVEAYNQQYEDKKLMHMLKDEDHYIPIVSASQFLDILKSISESSSN